MLNPKIADHHLIRNACIYIRQSTMAQVRFNQESTERQYNLADQAKSLGWMPEQIRILDGDLAQSGELTTKRDDFKTLVSDVAMGQVGAIFSLESSRLARSNKDWHRLLELCAVTKTLVFDGDGCYDPSDFNDSLVLGMKGTFAQAELHIIRARLHGAKLNRAQKGELRFPLPVGLVFDGDKIVLDPDQEVQGAVRTVFTLFEQENSAYAVVQRFHQIGLLFPRRSYGGVWDGKLIWGSVDPSTGDRRSCESILRRHLRVWSVSILQEDRPHWRDLYSIAPDATRSVACCYSGPPSGLHHLGSIPRQSQSPRSEPDQQRGSRWACSRGSLLAAGRVALWHLRAASEYTLYR